MKRLIKILIADILITWHCFYKNLVTIFSEKPNNIHQHIIYYDKNNNIICIKCSCDKYFYVHNDFLKTK